MFSRLTHIFATLSASREHLQHLMTLNAEMLAAEMRENTRALVLDMILLALGAGGLFMASLALLAGAVWALSMVLPGWAAALVVGAAVGGGAMIFLLAAYLRLRRRTLVPRRTLATVKDEVQWAKNLIR